MKKPKGHKRFDTLSQLNHGGRGCHFQNNDGGCSMNRLASSTWYVAWHFGQ
jgi:hypothetical protein